jgi:hypothetical protein
MDGKPLPCQGVCLGYLSEDEVRNQFLQIEAEGVERPKLGVALNLSNVAGGGVVDFDCDSPEAEVKLKARFGGTFPRTPTYRSKRGLHRWFVRPSGLHVVGRVGSPGGIEGLDILIGNRARQMTMVPPTIHWSGVRYEWLPGLSVYEVPLATMPEGVGDWLWEECHKEWRKERAKKKGARPISFLQYVCRELFGEPEQWGDRKGEAMWRCVLHDDTNPSFRALPFDLTDKDTKLHREKWYCHPCNIGGDIWDLLAALRNSRWYSKQFDMRSTYFRPHHVGMVAYWWSEFQKLEQRDRESTAPTQIEGILPVAPMAPVPHGDSDSVSAALRKGLDVIRRGACVGDEELNGD